MMGRLVALFISVILALAIKPAHAIDPGTVQGHLQFGKQRYELRYVQAVRNPSNSQRLWILLTTTEISVRDAADASRMLTLAMSGKLRGVRLNVDAAGPKANELQGALLLSKEEAPGGEIVFGTSGEKFWERLTGGDNRIVGTLRYASPGGSPAWAIDVSFSAPVFTK